MLPRWSTRMAMEPSAVKATEDQGLVERDRDGGAATAATMLASDESAS